MLHRGLRGGLPNELPIDGGLLIGDPSPPIVRLDLTETATGTKLRLRVKPRAKQTKIQGVHRGALKLSVTAAPEKGKANDAVRALLASHLDLPPSAIELLSGHTSPDKLVHVPLPPDLVTRRLAVAQLDTLT